MSKRAVADERCACSGVESESELALDMTTIELFMNRGAMFIEYALRGGAALALSWTAWIVLTSAMADHNTVDPEAALSWRSDASIALLSLGKKRFLRATSSAHEQDRESVVFREVWNRGLVLRSNDADLPPKHPEEVLLVRTGRPNVGEVLSIARWLDLIFTRNFYAASVPKPLDESFETQIVDALTLSKAERRNSVLTTHYLSKHSPRRSSDENLAVAKALAKKSLVADPLQREALILLSDIYAREGDTRRSEALLRSAGNRTLRDPVLQAKLIDLLTYDGDYAGAIAKADALMRGFDGYVQRIAEEFLANIAMDARSFSALSNYLARDPPWRKALFEAVSRYDDAESGLRLLSQFASKGNALRGSDMAPTLQLLMKQDRSVEAYLAWVNFLSEEKRSKTGLLFDGNFTEEWSGVPFEWTVAQSPKGSVNFLPDQRVLRVEFVGAKLPKIAVHQTLSLSPGRYRLKMEAMSDELRVARGVSWRIACQSSDQRILVETEPLRGTKHWQEVSADFEMPPEGCDFPLLRLILKAKTPFELIANGVVSFRRMRLARLSGP